MENLRLEKKDHRKTVRLSRGLLYYKHARIYVPKGELRESLMKELHSTPMGGHRGEIATSAKLYKKFYWPELRYDVEMFIEGCLECQMHKPCNQKKSGLLRPLPKLRKTFESISMVFITQLPKVKSGDDAISVVVERLSKLAMFVSSRTMLNGDETATLFLDRWMVTNGLARDIVSDTRIKFIRSLWQHLTTRLKTKLKMNMAFYLETDSQMERVNGILIMYLRNYTTADKRDWDELLALSKFCYYPYKHLASKQTPCFVTRGFDF